MRSMPTAPVRPTTRGPRARARRHDWIDERSLALHRAIARHLERDPSLVQHARDNLERWAALRGEVAPAHAEWRQLLKRLSLPELLALLTDPGEEATRLRQSSPFKGILSPEERDRIFAYYESL